MRIGRISLVLAALAALGGSTGAAASDVACPNSEEVQPAIGAPAQGGWSGGGTMTERCASTTSTGGAEPTADDKPDGVKPGATRAAKPASKAAKARKAKAKHKSKKARLRAKRLRRR